MEKERLITNEPERAFVIGETVYSVVRPEEKGLIVGIWLRPESILYAVTWASAFQGESNHYAMELTTERSFGA